MQNPPQSTFPRNQVSHINIWMKEIELSNSALLGPCVMHTFCCTMCRKRFLLFPAITFEKQRKKTYRHYDRVNGDPNFVWCARKTVASKLEQRKKGMLGVPCICLSAFVHVYNIIYIHAVVFNFGALFFSPIGSKMRGFFRAHGTNENDKNRFFPR